MKAIVQDAYGSADVLELRDIATPAAGDGDVLVRVHAAGLDPGVWHLMTGLPYLVRVMGFGLRAPRDAVPGTDLAGRVEAVGKAVTRFRPGDDVFGIGTGAFAEVARAPDKALASKPGRLTFEQAAAVPTSALTALQGLRDAGRLQSGQHVLIVGAAGGVGTFAVQIGKILGAEVTGVCSTAKIDLVRRIGADHVIDYTQEDVTDGRRRYDVILDMAGRRPLGGLRRALTRRGVLVVGGGEGGGRWLGGMDRQLRALLLTPLVSQQLRPFIATARAEDLEHLRDLLDGGRLTPVIDRTFPLRDAPDAIRYLADGRGRGKVVITI